MIKRWLQFTHRRINSNTDRSAQRAAAVRADSVDCAWSQFRAARKYFCSSDTKGKGKGVPVWPRGFQEV